MARRAAHAYRRQIHGLAALSPLEAWRMRLDLARMIEDIADRDIRRRERETLDEILRDSRATYARLVSRSGRLRLPDRPPVVLSPWRA